jgi:hypothetical protein
MSDITDIFCYVGAQPGRQGFFLFRAKRCSSWCQLNPVYSIPERILFGGVGERKKKCVFFLFETEVFLQSWKERCLLNWITRFYAAVKGIAYFISYEKEWCITFKADAFLSDENWYWDFPRKKRQSIHCSLGKVFLHYIIARIFTLCSTDEKISAKL